MTADAPTPPDPPSRRSAGAWLILLLAWIVGLAVWGLYLAMIGWALYKVLS